MDIEKQRRIEADWVIQTPHDAEDKSGATSILSACSPLLLIALESCQPLHILHLWSFWHLLLQMVLGILLVDNLREAYSPHHAVVMSW